MPAKKDAIVFGDGQCSPKTSRNVARYGTCMPPSSLRAIGHMYNKEVTDEAQQIPKSAFRNNVTLKKELESRLGCGDEKCVAQSPVVQKMHDLYVQLKSMYRPDMPEEWKKNPRTWLNNFDINDVMVQYEESNPNFKFLGVVSVDFYDEQVCKYFDLCKFNLFDFIATKKRQFGIVFNLDKYSQGGSHWVSLFCNLVPSDPKFGFCYYDSAAREPPQHIRQFLVDIKRDADLFFKEHPVKFFEKKLKAQYNVREHQLKNTECGMFSMLFIIACLEHKGKDYNGVCNLLGRGSDDYVHTYRKRLFRS